MEGEDEVSEFRKKNIIYTTHMYMQMIQRKDDLYTAFTNTMKMSRR